MPNIDHFVPDNVVAQEFHVTLMTIWRWDRRPGMAALGWPAKLKIGERNYRNRSAVEAFKHNLLQRAAEAARALPDRGKP